MPPVTLDQAERAGGEHGDRQVRCHRTGEPDDRTDRKVGALG
jgi:hypothetical protein